MPVEAGGFRIREVPSWNSPWYLPWTVPGKLHIVFAVIN
jgi:hypothetical protein